MATIPRHEIMEFLEKRKGLIEALVISGGEPTLWPELEDFIRSVKQKGFLVKLDTNGSRPEVLESLVEEGLLDYVAMDIKNVPARYGETCGLGAMDLRPVLRSVEFLLGGKVPWEFRTTVMQEFHRMEEFPELGKWLQGAGKFVIQNYHPRQGQVEDRVFTPFTDAMLEEAKGIMSGWVERVEIRR